ncbi:hypothetical protein [Bacillus wiedmannii]|uniref:hypothetical protein n=1 Tax=Bacillus wiedmannii TaxID=1890302 RepID=UPI003D953517
MKQLWKETDGFAVFSFYHAHNSSIEERFANRHPYLPMTFSISFGRLKRKGEITYAYNE